MRGMSLADSLRGLRALEHDVIAMMVEVHRWREVGVALVRLEETHPTLAADLARELEAIRTMPPIAQSSSSGSVSDALSSSAAKESGDSAASMAVDASIPTR